jgi:glycosyltransferase involved in cell wall biosynthesis
VHVPPYKPLSLKRFLGKVKRKVTGAPPPPDPYAAVRDPRGEPEAPPAPAPLDGRHPWVPAIERRWKEVKAQLDLVDLFVAPSNFLRERFIEAGMIAADRIVYSDSGFDHGPFEDMPPRRERGDGPVRLGFIGSIAEQKGVHLIVEAFNELPEDGVECRIYGGLTGWPDYVELVRARRAHLGVRLMGPYVNNKVAEVLRSVDALIVPSRWYENSPLTIHEAFMAGIPVITGDRGGMAELVKHDVNGLHFRMDSAPDLRYQIERLMNEPGLLEKITRETPVKTIAEDARETEERLEELASRAVHAG